MLPRGLTLLLAATECAAVRPGLAADGFATKLSVSALTQRPPSPPPPSWQYKNCSSCIDAGLLWCYWNEKCWTQHDPKDRVPQSCALNLDWCAADKNCKCSSCGDTRCQPPAPAPNPPPAPQRPIQGVHLALGKTPDTMTVSWTTAVSSPGGSVRYGLAGGALSRSAASDERPLNISGSRFTHVATLSGLKPAQNYAYQIVGDSLNFSFIFRRNGGARRNGPDYHVIFGDMGSSHGFSLCSACTAGSTNCEAAACANTSAGLVSEVETADMMLHVGDFAYDLDSDGGRVGDQFMRNIEQVAAYVPYMVSHGNHEDSPASLAHYIERFRGMPSESTPPTVTTLAGAGVNTLWYSWDAGLVHYIAIDTEIWSKVAERAEMLKWLRSDLTQAQANRKNVPWIVTHGHQSVYCSTADDSDCNLPFGPAWNYRLELEPLFFEFGVDFWINGHEHSYERSYPTYKSKSDRSNLDPKATIYIVTGAAGCSEMHEGFSRVAPTWSAFRANTFGYSRMIVHNASHIHWQQVSTDPTAFPLSEYGRVIDDTWIVQHQHGPFSHATAPTGTAWPAGDESPERSLDHWAPLLGLDDGTGRATSALIREYVVANGERAFAELEDQLLERVNGLTGGRNGSTVWEDVRADGASDGQWFKTFAWRGQHA